MLPAAVRVSRTCHSTVTRPTDAPQQECASQGHGTARSGDPQILNSRSARLKDMAQHGHETYRCRRGSRNPQMQERVTRPTDAPQQECVSQGHGAARSRDPQMQERVTRPTDAGEGHETHRCRRGSRDLQVQERVTRPTDAPQQECASQGHGTARSRDPQM